ncbi:site-specific integrase [Methylocystis sp. WRRC1]|uniref:site-specific integrase n=1 Tax=Methylocystis sp. WRRC1 TaxID=1732014 RepID=UPI001D1499B0|nr:site-specific integrase [Methylocystis sp. WRRC1]MCC3243797.1 site-specific integrase [Methylocystis sp. WRRC1]
MISERLTKRVVDALQPRAKPYIAYDADLTGFGLRVMPSGVKSWVVEYRPDGGGRGVAKKRVTLGKMGALTPEQGRRAASELLARVTLGADPAAEKADKRDALTVAGLIDAFVAEHVDGKLKPASAISAKAGLEKLRAAHGSLKAEALTRAQLAALHSSMRATPYLANRHLAAWRKMYAWAETRGLVPEGYNPAKRIEAFREQARERYLSTGELARLGDALRLCEREGVDPGAVAAIKLLILTGARLQEILKARWSLFDGERGVIFLADSKTGRKPLYLSAPAQAVLAGLPRIEGNPYIITGARPGQPRADLNKPWARVKRIAGLEGVRLHDLRHSFASVGAGASLGLPTIGRLLGHATPAATHRYSHVAADPLRRAADTIGAMIAAAMDGAGDGKVTPLRRKGRGE